MGAYDYFEAIYQGTSLAPGWNTPAVDREVLAWLDELLHAAPIEPPCRMLEIGCGMGNLSLPLAHRNHEITGLDVSATAIEAARARAAPLGDAAPRFRVGDVTDAASYAGLRELDVVVDGLCLHCIVGADRARLLRLVRSVLRPGGCLLVMTMCGEPRAPALKERFDAASRCIRSHGIAQRYLGQAPDLQAELVEAGYALTYVRQQPGDDATGDQDMLLAVARVAERP